MRIRLFFILLGMSILAPAASAADPEPVRVPEWFIKEIATLTAGNGRWITDNAQYQGESEPYDAYGVEWKASFDGLSVRGRLFGMKDGEEVADFWEFRQYWHPGRKEAVVEQFGWRGAVGIGTAYPDGDKLKADQTFWFANGTVDRTGHESWFANETTHVTHSFDIEGDAWIPRRQYTWHREQAAQ